jgi:hypothetical protein
MPLPWKTILLHGPTIVEAARKLYAATRKGAAEPNPMGQGTDGTELRRALETLTERQMQHAALLNDLAGQVQAMAAELDLLRRRVRFALVGGGLSTALAIAAVVLALWRVR